MPEIDPNPTMELKVIDSNLSDKEPAVTTSSRNRRGLPRWARMVRTAVAASLASAYGWAISDGVFRQLQPYQTIPAYTGQALKTLEKDCHGTVLFKNTCYDWAGAYQEDNGDFSALGVSVDFRQSNPEVTPMANDALNHSLAEIWAGDSEDRQAIEVGWWKNSGDSGPSLFATDWVNNKFIGFANINTTGFVDTGSNMHVGNSVTTGAIGSYGIKFANNNWDILYDDQVVGHFPESIWTSRKAKFTSIGYINIYGEVAIGNPSSPTQMGNGTPGCQPGAATATNYRLFDSTVAPSLDDFNADNGPGAGYSICQTGPTSFTFGGEGYKN